MARSVLVRRTLTLASTGVLAGLGLLAVAAPAQADVAPAVPASVILVQPGHAYFGSDYPDWTWCPYGYYWHHEGLLTGLLDGTGHLLGSLL
jgi:hypothetical protein